MSTITINIPELYPKQREALFTDARFSYIEGATKSGKTLGCLVWLFTQAIRDDGAGQYWWVAPFSHQANMAFDRMKNLLPDDIYDAHETHKYIKLEDAGRIWFKTADNEQSLYGEDVQAVVADEASRMSWEAFYALRSTLFATHADGRFIGNVVSRSTWHFRQCRRAERGELENAEYHKLTVKDAIEADETPITQEKFDEIAKDYAHDEQMLRALFFCEPPDHAGNPFGLDNIADCEIHVHPDDPTPDNLRGPPVMFGWDLARSQNYTVGIGLNEHGNVCQLHRWQGRDWDAMLNDIVTIIGPVTAVMDETGAGDPVVEWVKKRADGHIIPFQIQTKSKDHLLERLKIGIQNEKLHFQGGTPLGEELRHIEYSDKERGLRYQAEEGHNDDCVDALALAWAFWEKKHGHQKRRRKQSVSVGGAGGLRNPFD